MAADGHERELDAMRDDIRDIRITANAAQGEITTHEAVCAERYRAITQRLQWMLTIISLLMLIELGKAGWPELARLLLR